MRTPLQSLRFRPPHHHEADKLSALAHASKRRWGYPEAWMALWETSLTVRPEDLEAWQFDIAEIDGTILGYFALSPSRDTATLEHFWIAPGCEGQGYGRQMLQRAMWRCEQIGAPRLQVVSDPNAEAFYLKMGGTRIGEAPSVPAPRTLPIIEFAIRRRASEIPIGGNGLAPGTLEQAIIGCSFATAAGRRLQTN